MRDGPLDNAKLAIYRRLPTRLRILAARHGTPNYTVGTIGLITRDGTDLLLVRPSYRHGWVPPGGFVAVGETPLQALEREIQEELGVRMSFEPAHRVAFDVRRRGVTFVSAGIAPAGAAFTVCTRELDDVGWFALDALPPLPHDFFEGVPAEDLEAIRVMGDTAR